MWEWWEVHKNSPVVIAPVVWIMGFAFGMLFTFRHETKDEDPITYRERCVAFYISLFWPLAFIVWIIILLCWAVFLLVKNAPRLLFVHVPSAVVCVTKEVFFSVKEATLAVVESTQTEPEPDPTQPEPEKQLSDYQLFLRCLARRAIDGNDERVYSSHGWVSYKQSDGRWAIHFFNNPEGTMRWIGLIHIVKEITGTTFDTGTPDYVLCDYLEEHL